MGVFDRLFNGAEDDKRDDTLDGRNIAVGRAEFYGSVHSGGDVDVEVGTQYGERQVPGISVKASVHGTGNENLTVKELVDHSDVPDEWGLPSEGLDGGGSPVRRRIDAHGSVHDYGNFNYHIDRLVIVPNVGGERSIRAEGDDSILRAFAEHGFDVAQELNVRGSVHNRGKLSVTIDNLVVME